MTATIVAVIAAPARRTAHRGRRVAGRRSRLLTVLALIIGMIPISQFTAAVTLAAGTFVVNSTGDAGDANAGNGVCETSTSGQCTLRAAIEEANALVGTDTINFNIPTSDPGYSASPLSYTIQAGSAGGLNLPASTGRVVIDGTMQPDFAGTPVIVIDSTLGGSSDQNGITLQAGDSTIRGVVIVNSGDDAIEVEISGGNTIVGNYIGVGVDGTTAAANKYGLSIKSDGNTIGGTLPADRNVIAGNANYGLAIYNESTNNAVRGNYIGVSADGSSPAGNGTTGIEIYDGANNNTIGGATPAHGNVISGNGTGEAGILIDGGTSSGNIIQYNRIGTNADGDAAIPNNLHGIIIDNAPGTQILDNLISGNDVHGIYVNNIGATGTQILRNTIGTNLAATAPLPNGFDGVRIEGWANGAIIGSPGNGNVIAGTRNAAST